MSDARTELGFSVVRYAKAVRRIAWAASVGSTCLSKRESSSSDSAPSGALAPLRRFGLRVRRHVLSSRSRSTASCPAARRRSAPRGPRQARLLSDPRHVLLGEVHHGVVASIESRIPSSFQNPCMRSRTTRASKLPNSSRESGRQLLIVSKTETRRRPQTVAPCRLIGAVSSYH